MNNLNSIILFLYLNISPFIPDIIVRIGLSSILYTLIFLLGFIFGPFWGLLVGSVGSLIGDSYYIWRVMGPKTIDNFTAGFITESVFPRMIYNGLLSFLIGLVPVICKYKSIHKRIISYNIGILSILFCDYIFHIILSKLKYDDNILIYSKDFIFEPVIPRLFSAIFGSIFLYFYYKFIIPKTENKIM